MANKKISELNSITNAGLATTDVIPVVDLSAVETKKITISELDLRYTNETYVDAGDATTLSSAQSYSDSGISTHSADTTSVHGIADTSALATKTGTEELTNKKLTGGTASSSRVWTPPSDTKANLDALTRVAGAIYYATDDDLFYKDNGSVLVPLQNNPPVIMTIENASCSSSFVSGTYTIVNFGSATIDTNSGWNGSNTYTVQSGKDGYYCVNTALFFINGGGNTSSGIMIFINGSLRYQLFSEDPTSVYSAHASQYYNLVATDTISIYMYTQFSGSSPSFAGGQGQLYITKLG